MFGLMPKWTRMTRNYPKETGEKLYGPLVRNVRPRLLPTSNFAPNAEPKLKKKIYAFIAGTNSLPAPSSVLNAGKKPVEMF